MNEGLGVKERNWKSRVYILRNLSLFGEYRDLKGEESKGGKKREHSFRTGKKYFYEVE